MEARTTNGRIDDRLIVILARSITLGAHADESAQRTGVLEERQVSVKLRHTENIERQRIGSERLEALKRGV